MGKHSQTTAAARLEKYARHPPAENTTQVEDNPVPPESQDVSMQQLLAAITASEKKVTDKIGEVQMDISLLRQDMQKTQERVSEVEHRISDLEDVTTPLKAQVEEFATQMRSYQLKLSDIEGRLRRNNVRFVGLPEKAEGSHPEAFLEKWLTEKFGHNDFSRHFAVERAHRIPMQSLPPGAPSRTFIAKILHFKDRDAILRLARTKGPLEYNGHKVSVFPDFSTEVQKSRSQFLQIKRRLRDLHYPYAMLYPARLRVVAGETTHFFGTPKEATAWLDRVAPTRDQLER